MQKTPTWILWILFFIYSALSYIGILHHEIWADEMQHWLLAKDSQTLKELFYNIRYEGHPPLWHLLLFLVSRFTDDPFGMQILHLIISIIAAFLFLYKAPFNLLQKIAIIFGYYGLFEYNLISRNYNTTWLLLVIVCILYTRKQKNLLSISTVLLLLIFNHLFSMVIAVSLCLVIAGDCRKKRIPFKGLSVILGIAILLSLFSMLPPMDSFILKQSGQDIVSIERLSHAFSFYIKGLFSVPDFTEYHFWNTNYFISHFKTVTVLFSAFLFFIPFLLFFDKPIPLFLFYFSSLGIVVCMYALRLFNGTHYMGHVFMLLIVSLWLSKKTVPGSNTVFLQKYYPHGEGIRQKAYTPFIVLLLTVQFYSGLSAYYKDYKYSFSEGGNAAEYIAKYTDSTSLVIVGPYNSGPSVSGYLNKKIYYPEINRAGTFCEWNRWQKFNHAQIFKKMKAVADTSQANAIAIALAYPADTLKLLNPLLEKSFNIYPYRIEEKNWFNEGIVKGENYKVYIIRKSKNQVWKKR